MSNKKITAKDHDSSHNEIILFRKEEDVKRSSALLKECGYNTVTVEEVCTCGNPEMGFNCACDWMEKNPGNKHYSCDLCGIYKASKPQCNLCEECI